MAKKDEVTKTSKTPKAPKELISEILPTRYRLKCKNHPQKEFAKVITEKEIIIVTGPAGVGKSYVSVARAIELLQNKTGPYHKIIITTPAEEVGENLGFIPGTLREKMEPYIAATMDIFDKIIGKTKRMELERADILQIQPLGFIRGKSIDNTIFILEEGQNMSPTQMKAVLTRIGDNSKFIISGDLDQSDRYRDYKQSGLYDAIQRHKNVEEIAYVTFETKDIVRNPLIIKILDNYKVVESASVVDKTKVISTNPRMVSECGLKKCKDDKIVKWFRKNFTW